MNQSVGELRVDFVSGAVAHRLRFGGGRGQALAKAMGLRAGKTPSIIDATAGLGRDSFLLASLGAQVTLIERSEQMHSLLVQGMERARQEGGEFSEIMDRMTLLQGDAKDLLPGLSAEAILIDPMHPPRTNSALVKRELRQVREIVGTDEDAAELVQCGSSTRASSGCFEMACQGGADCGHKRLLTSDLGKIHTLRCLHAGVGQPLFCA